MDATTKVRARVIVRAWLLSYAWNESSDAEKRAIVDCIMAQDDWQFIDSVADAFAGASSVPGPEAFHEGQQYALSALYECHEGPHTSDCPSRAYRLWCDLIAEPTGDWSRPGDVNTNDFYSEGQNK